MQTSYIPKKRCTKLVLSSCFPKAAYGIELSTINDGTFQRFRTNVKKSLGYHKQGSSPWITLSLLGKNVDFEHYTITRTIFFWRKYIQIFPHRAQDICRKISTNSKGPLQGIIACFNKLGNITPLGLWNTQHFGLINWITVSKKWLKYIIAFEWKAYVCNQLQHRQNFLTTMVDTEGFANNLKKFDDEEQRIILNHAGGTHYTRDAQSHFDDVTSDLCPFCQEERDSRSHRILKCPFLAPCRSHFSVDTWKELRANRTMSHFGLIPVTNNDKLFRHQFNRVQPIFPQYILQPMHIFTDGSCFHNQHRHFAIGGSAAIFYAEINQLDPTFTFRTILPTVEHSSYRAEIYATFLAIKMCAKPTIYTDCQAVIDTWGIILRALKSHTTPIIDDHIDLWGPIIECAATSYLDINIVKVKAHTAGTDWFSIANAYADSEAKKSVAEDHHDLLEFATRRVASLLRLRHIQHQVMLFQTQAAVMEFNSHRQDLHLGNMDTPRMASPVEPLRLLCIDIGNVNCIYGNTFLHRLASWASGIYWETDPHHSTSFLELMLQFIYSTCSLPPFPVEKFPNRPSNNQKEWILKDQHPSRDFQGYTCQDILTSFIRTVKWVKRNHNIDLFPDGVQMQVNSLHIFHYKGHTGGIRFRAHLPHTEQIQIFCETHLPYRKNLKIPIPRFSSHN